VLPALLLLTLAIDPFEGLPNVEVEAPVADKLESLDTPVYARAFRVRMKFPDAWDWVFKSFVRHKLFVPAAENRGQLDGLPQLTGYDHHTRQSYTAIFKDNGDGTLTVIAGRADLSAGAWVHASEKPPAMPAMPGATDVTQTNSEAGLTMTYVVKASPQEIEAFYAEVFEKNGFKRDDDAKGWVKRGQLVEVQHTPRGKETRAVALTARPLPDR
jgi:hypothetical protein